MRAYIGILSFGIAAASCTQPTPRESPTDLARADVVAAVTARMRATLADLDEMNAVSLDTVFLADRAAINIEDTVMTVGHDRLAGYFAAALKGLKSIDSVAFDSVHVIPFGADAAMAVTKFQEVLTLPDGTRIFDRGVWSSSFVRTSAGWKMVTAHVSHAPAPPQQRPR